MGRAGRHARQDPRVGWERKRDTGQLDSADAAHKEAVKLLRAMLDKKSKQINEADVVYFMAECQIEQARTWAKIGKPAYQSGWRLLHAWR